jgi:signal transduction histidine kinase
MSKSLPELKSIAYSAAPADERAAALNLLSEHLSGIDQQESLRYAEEAIALAESLADQSHHLTARLNRAWVRHEMGDYALSAREAAEVIKIARQRHLPEQAYDAYNILGNNHNRVGNRPEALDAFMQALDLAKTMSNPIKVASIENNIGMVYEGMQDFHQSLAYYQKALDTYRAGGANLILQTIAGTNVAESCNALAQYEQALPIAQEAFQLAAERGYHVGKGKAQLQWAIALAGLGRAQEAAINFEEALEHIRMADSPYNESLVLKHMAMLSIQQGRLDEGVERLDKALALVEPLQTLPAIFPLHEALAQVYEQTGDFRKAYRHLKRYQQIKEQVFNEQADSREKTLHALFELDRARLEAENQRHRNVALQHQLEQYEGVIAELDAYAANVAHDLKNPIGVILGFATILEMDLEPYLDETRRDNLRILSTTAGQMQTIVEALLSLAQARKAEIMPQPVDMNQVVQNALARVEMDVLAQGATVELENPLPPALAHPEWLEEAWVNYLSNALKYGGAPPRIRIDAVTEADGLIRYRVSDNGQGLTPDDMSRLFTRFERLGQQKIEGSGIGLTIVKTIVEKLGGRVGVESPGVAGQGSSFSFVLHPVEA